MSSNKFHYGNLTITGSLMAQSITGSLQGTASYALNSPPSISSSYALTASYLEGTIASASYALTASYALNGGTTIDTGSLVTTSSFNNFTSSYSTGSFTGSFIGDGSGLIGVVSSSYAATSSIALSSSYSLSSSYAASASLSTTSLNTSDILIYVKNTTGATIEKGKVVKISGATGDNALISTASYNSEGSSANTLGILNETIADQAFGYVMTEGKLLGIDTSTFTAGQLLYLGPTGSIVSSPPLAPLHTVRLGQALRIQSNNGSMYVRIDNGYELDELHNVLIISGSDGDLIVASGSNGNGGKLYVNTKQLTGSYGLTGSLSVLSGSIISNLVGTASWADNSNTASYVQNAQSASYYVETDPIFVAKSGSLATTGSNTFVGDQIIQGNLNVVGTASFVYTTSSIINIGSSIINLNTNNPATRFGGITVIDSGSFGTSSTGSLFWDSQNNRWIYANPSGSTYDGGMFISGPRNTSGIGNEVGVTNNFLVVGNGTDHISSSMIFHSASITQITGSLEVISGITGSLLGTASTASYIQNAQSASYVQNAQTASYVVNAISASYVNLAQTASYYVETDPLFVSKSGSLATTGSNFFNGNQTITGSLNISGSGNTNELIVGTNKLFVSSSGNVGIGTSSPSRKLSVNGVFGVQYNDATESFAVNPTSTGTDFIIKNGSNPTLGEFRVDTRTGQRFAYYNGGNFAIGSQADDGVNKLQVNGRAIITGSLNVTAGITGSLLGTASTASYYVETDPLFVSKSGSLATTGSNTFVGNQTIQGLTRITGTASNELVRITQTGTGAALIVEDSSNPDGTPFIIDSSGNVGVGTLTPNATLDINGNTIITGSLNVTSGITGSLLGTASTASYVNLAQSASSGDNFRVRGTLNADGVQFIRQYGGTSTNWFSASLAIGKGFTANATLDVTGSAIITGSLIVTTGITGSLLGTASTASYYDGSVISSSYATTSSYSQLAATASYFSGSISNAVNATSASYALTASYVVGGSVGNAFPYTGSAGISGSLMINSFVPYTVNDFIGIRGDANSYVQTNIQNFNSGVNASTDVVATADNGNDSINYIDMGINSSTYSNAGYTITGPNDGYLYSQGGKLAIGTASTQSIVFFTGGTLAANNRGGIDKDGQWNINGKNLTLSGSLTLQSTSSITLNATDTTNLILPTTGTLSTNESMYGIINAMVIGNIFM